MSIAAAPASASVAIRLIAVLPPLEMTRLGICQISERSASRKRASYARSLTKPLGGAAADGAVVVEPHQRDHVADVGVVTDRPRGRSDPAREHGVLDHAPLRVELLPDRLGEGEVGRAVAVQVADLAPADAERELPAAARP